jgi:hypothetical protein
MQQSIRRNTARLDRLEASHDALNVLVGRILTGLMMQQKKAMVMGFIGTVVAVVFLGAAGGLFAGFENTIGALVDFGDLSPIKQVLESIGESDSLQHIEADRYVVVKAFMKSDFNIDRPPFVLIAAAASLVETAVHSGVPRSM